MEASKATRFGPNCPGNFVDAGDVIDGKRLSELLVERGIVKIDVKNDRSTTPTEQDVSEALDRWCDALETLALEQRGKGSIV